MMPETETQQIERARRGERGAVEWLMERCRRAVVATAYQALGNADDAQDVAQETLVYAMLRLSDLRDPSRLSAWLRQITLTQCADYRRRRATRRLGEPITVLNEAAEEMRYAERYAIRRAVEGLSEAHRTTLLLHYQGGWSLTEVATLLDIPVNTVRSRLLSAKRHLRNDLLPLFTARNPMRTETPILTDLQMSLITAAFPKATVLATVEHPEPWMPFFLRIRLETAGGVETTVDLRADIDPAGAGLLPILAQQGIAGPRCLHGPVADGEGGYLTLCAPPAGDNLLLWALGGTPHRIRLATERTFEAIDRLQAATDALLADPAGSRLPRRTLADEAAVLTNEPRVWETDPWFVAARAKVQAAVADIGDPLVYTHYLHFFPNFYRIEPGIDPFDTPLGWPGDHRMEANPLAEFVSPFGAIGDPLLGLAMVWIYDCYPFVHTGFVEQYLWRHNASRRDFAPRLALQALRTIVRELPLTRPDEGSGYWDALHGYVDQALAWM